MIKRLVLLVLTLALFLCGCNKRERILLSTCEDLSDSMQNYLNTDSQSFKSGHFEAKIIDISKVYYYDEYHQDKHIYKIIVGIAPLYDDPIQLKKVVFNLNEEAYNYYSQYKWYFGYDQLNSPRLDNFDVPATTSYTDAQAYRFDLLISNVSDEIQKDNNYTDKQFDDLLKHLSVDIFYDNTKDTIKLEYQGTVKNYNEYDKIPESRRDLKNIYQAGESVREILAQYFSW